VGGLKDIVRGGKRKKKRENLTQHRGGGLRAEGQAFHRRMRETKGVIQINCTCATAQLHLTDTKENVNNRGGGKRGRKYKTKKCAGGSAIKFAKGERTRMFSWLGAAEEGGTEEKNTQNYSRRCGKGPRSFREKKWGELGR